MPLRICGVAVSRAAGLGRDAEWVQLPLTSERVWRALQRDFGPALFA